MRSSYVVIPTFTRPKRRNFTPAVFAFVAIGCLMCGLYLLWLHAQGASPQPYRAPAGLQILVASGLQLWWTRHAWQRRAHDSHLGRPERLLMLEWLFVGAVACYAASLFLGPDPSVGYLFAAAIIGWYTLGVWLLIERRELLHRAAEAIRRRLIARTNHVVFASVCVFVAAEAVVRFYAYVAGDPLTEAFVARSHVLPAGQEYHGRLVNTLGYWDDEFKSTPRAGIYRIAVLGDSVTLSGTAQTNCLEQIERRVPGVEIYNFGIPAAGPREYAAQLMHEVVRFQPDLVLTFFSVGNDLTEELPLPGWFDWRGLGMYQLGARGIATTQSSPRSTQCQEDREAYLRDCTQHLAVCRTPLDEQMIARWRQTSNHLDAMARFCRRQNLPLAIVAVPGPFQVNPSLCDALRRQAGYEPGQVDLELPQRRLAAFAAEHDVPLVDLLPHFKSSETCTYERHDQQLNDHGNQITADVVGRWIEQHYRTQIASARQARN